MKTKIKRIWRRILYSDMVFNTNCVIVLLIVFLVYIFIVYGFTNVLNLLFV